MSTFEEERERLLAVLGEMTAGGIVADAQHIGATSVPDVTASTVSTALDGAPCVDIALSVWPFPLEPARKAALERLGYQAVAGYAGAPEQRFREAGGRFQLFVVDVGSELWLDYQILRDYLRQDDAARLAYAAERAQPGCDKGQCFEQWLALARPWWVQQRGFAPVAELAQELKDFAHNWYVSSGWALDLFLGRVTRAHFDVDVVVARADQLDLQQHMISRGWKFMTPLKARLEPWPMHMRMELPRHQAHAHRSGAFIDFLLTDMEHGAWRYRRDRTIIQSTERIGLRTTGAVPGLGAGIPFLAPELALLFKSKNTSNKPEHNKDQDDFEQVIPHLSAESRAWLRWALLATDPAHPWIERLV
jgi:GrpB-like predicted nucleotidyltransferase (UPF0157 family)